MKRVMIGVLSGFLFLVAAANGAFADPCACGGHMAQGGMAEGMHGGPWVAGPGRGFMSHSPEGIHFLWKKLMALDLTDKQRDSLREIKSRVVKETIMKRADLELARVELGELLHKDTVDMAAVEAKLKKTEALRTDLHLSHIKAREEVKAVLTPEQRKKFKEEMKTAFMMGAGHGWNRGPAGQSDPAQDRE